jgi:hypothetical protein
MDATIKGAGPQENVEAQVDPAHQAVRASLRPLDHIVGGVAGGHYGIVAYSGAVVAGQTAGSVLFAVRFVSSTKLMVLKSLRVGQTITTAYTTLIPPDVELVLARSFTVGYSVNNGTPLALGAFSNKARDQMAASEFAGAQGSIVPCTTSGMTTATISLDSYPYSYAAPPVAGLAIGSAGVMVLYDETQHGKHPLVFGTNQGFVVRFANTTGATGVSKLGITMEWAEVAGY